MTRIFLWGALALLALSAPAAWIPQADAQSVLKVARGLNSNNITVLINRAVVIESAQPFVEVSVANPETADVSPLSDSSIYIFGRQRGTTTLTLLGANGRLITNVTIKVEPDLSELKGRLRELLPREPIEVRTAANGLVLSGTVSGKLKIDKAMALARAYGGESVINMMTVGGTQQVMLKVKVAEINRGAGKDLGLSLGLITSGQRTSAGVFTGNTVRPSGERGPTGSRGNNPDGQRSEPNFGGGLDITQAAAGAFAGTFGAAVLIANNFLLDIQIDALESKGFAKTLSEPNLIALSGIEASFLAGGEVPIPTVDSDGEVTVEFKPVGVNLNFLPQVLDDDLINISVSAEVSQVDPTLTTVVAGLESVGFQTRRATTTVELRDGQAFAIAGLLQDSFEDTINQVPWLGDLPVLGALFRSTNYQRGESELVIIVSAHLVTPADSADQLALPTDRIRIPNETELFLLGNTTDQTTVGVGSLPISGQSFDGDFGYVVE